MKRIVIVITLLFPMACLSHGIDTLEAKRPNILLLVADDLCYADLGWLGGDVETPHVDAIRF